ncbi:serine hydrolase domain-containing protein [Candidatus Mycobacterium wuenschmannii]|uniref:Serine hydrolase domain-containing protein n=2 Tax=Candidatus Mycobacterium wuenschmannii TaxID=3027808 RepID=A0ABY8VUY8_9MYCO|nr:serine hydrolase domain-containing protein [Candidatus Mycobacterium wuenschmannii]WIM87468.1 serine hydrolase domain-containing protein [Candidatus Mycobacterium wuenschmannii]
MNDAIAAEKLPGGVVVVGHGGRIVFHQAYGSRKLAGEDGLDGSPAPAEPMTEDTIFDIASMTKSLATATAVMQLHEKGLVAFDEPVQTYLPDFNPDNDPVRQRVTVRMLLTHTSGEPIDVNLDDPWGVDAPDKAEGIRRALSAPLQSAPGEVYRYADINYILLGAMLEKLTGEAEDDYVQRNIFAPLGMTDTRYLPPAEVRPRIAPTAVDDRGHLLRGTVHDPTTRRMGGVAGHAGIFSTAHDVALYAQALLDRLANRPSTFPLQQATLAMMTTPQQPGRRPGQVEAANDAVRKAAATAPNPMDPLLAPHYPAIEGQELFGFGWDIDTAFSKPRGLVFPVGSFGGTGFTGTSLWLDPGSDTYVVLLTNAIHVRGSEPISGLRGDVATAAADGVGL